MNITKPVILLTGSPGIGKSTIIKKVSELVGHEAAGFYTREVRKDELRVGFEIVTLDGERVLLAIKGGDIVFSNQVLFGSYKINLDAMEKIAVPKLREAASSRKIIIVDEIGPMELFSKSFCQVITQILEDNTITVIGTIVRRQYEF